MKEGDLDILAEVSLKYNEDVLPLMKWLLNHEKKN